MAMQATIAQHAPAHVAIIMDGNRRWAVRNCAPLIEGYRHGIDALREAVCAARELGVRVLTVYGFSTDNWRRAHSEIAILMQLCASFARTEREHLSREGVRVRIIGDIEPFPLAVRAALSALVHATRRNHALTLNLALNYSGRAEILRAVRSIAADVACRDLDAGAVDETQFRSRLYAPEIPDPDLLIRTGGDLRISNFLLYQLAYTEIVSLPTLWPDFTREQFAQAMHDFTARNRRFGA
jgi:undecaprenyl diphosphate synthase